MPAPRKPGQPQRRLDDAIKTEIVRRLARWDRPQEIARAIKEDFGIELDRHHVQTYDPTKPVFAAGEKWSAMFHAMREAHCKDLSTLRYTNPEQRMALLERGIEKAEAQGNYVLAAALAEQIAKDMGGLYTNARQHSHSGTVGRYSMTPEDAKAELLVRAAAARDKALEAKQTQH